MPQKQAAFKIKGMSRDLAVSAFNSEFAYDNHNIRITADKTNTLYTIVNELGNTKELLNSTNFVINGGIQGIPLGYCVLNDNAIVFTHDNNNKNSPDVIYCIFEKDRHLNVKCLFNGNLGFEYKYPIETLGCYENENIQKVYWVDGKNQPRVINIAASDIERSNWTNDYFNFLRYLSSKEDIDIQRVPSGGIFSVGTIQYHFTYFNKNMQESSIFYSSPLYYCSNDDRGISPEGKAGNCFRIHLNNLDSVHFKYLRIYSSQRSSKDAAPEVRKIIDINISNTTEVTYNDTGEHGQTIDYNTLFYLGGVEIIASTISQKDNTLFLGNIQTPNYLVSQDVKDWVKECAIGGAHPITFKNYIDDRYTSPKATGFYPYVNNLKLGSNNIKTFKYSEWYRFGVQFKLKTGKWTEAIFIRDLKNLVHQNTKIEALSSTILGSTTTSTKLVYAECTLNSSNTFNIEDLINTHQFLEVRPIVVFPSINDRECVCQGVLNPTVYNVEDRINNTPYAISSWYFRPNAPYNIPKKADGTDDHKADWKPDIANPSSTVVSPFSENAIVSGRYNKSNVVSITGDISTTSTVRYGAALEFRHNKQIPPNSFRNAEIQCIEEELDAALYKSNQSFTPIEFESKKNLFIKEFNHRNYYFIDQSIITLHSPDIEFDTDVQLLDTKGLSLRIVGVVPITSNITDIDITTLTGTTDTSQYAGFYKEPIQSSTDIRVTGDSLFAWRSLASGIFWYDRLLYSKSEFRHAASFVVYPWHRTTGLANDSGSENATSLLNKKILSNLRASLNSIFYEYDDIWKKPDYESTEDFISDIKFFNSNEITAIKLNAPKYSTNNQDILYYGNYDKVLSSDPVFNIAADNDKDFKVGYSYALGHTTTEKDAYKKGLSNYNNNYVNFRERTVSRVQLEDGKGGGSSDPVRIKFKSTPHCVIALNDMKNFKSQRILPSIYNVNYEGDRIVKGLFWNPEYTGYYQVIMPKYPLDGYIKQYPNVRCGWLWLGELYRPDTPELQKTRFGGNTPEAIENNVWIPAGESVKLLDDNGNPKKEITIQWTEGDTYYQRYDHLKTYPFTPEDQQSMVDILSFMCETRINLDGRYDSNRGLSSNIHITPTIFNKINMAYTQDNNLFTYRSINENKINIDKYPVSIVWSKVKILGDLTDTWTNISMSSVMDLDGDKGNITAIRRLNDKLIAFQEKGVSQILYNEKEQLATTEGQAVEISNSGKVSGKRYLSTNNGCTNKWSIQEAESGLYFIDDNSKSLCHFSGEGFTDISYTLGMKSWFNNRCSTSIWNPESFTNTISYYDKSTNDLYFIYKDIALAFNDKLKVFTSFYDYGNTPVMFNIKNNNYTIHKDGELYFFWKQHNGNYNYIFNEYKPFYTTVIANQDPTMDKTFNNVEFRSDILEWNLDERKWTIVDDEYPLDTLIVENEYQKGECYLNINRNHSSSLQKKFRIWRANIPRNKETFNTKFLKGDRIRNPWAYVTLKKSIPNIYRTELHDILVHYFI